MDNVRILVRMDFVKVSRTRGQIKCVLEIVVVNLSERQEPVCHISSLSLSHTHIHTHTGFCDDTYIIQSNNRLRGGNDCSNPYNFICVKLPNPMPWSHNAPRSKVTTASGEDLYLNYPTPNMDAYPWTEKSSVCEQAICETPFETNNNALFKKDRYGNFVKAFHCDNPCQLTCELNNSEDYPKWNSYSTKDKQNQTIVLDEDLKMNEIWWNPKCPELICNITTLRHKFVVVGDDVKNAQC